MSFKVPKHYMVNHPLLGIGEGNNGFFRFVLDNVHINAMASDGEGWEHVSVSLNKARCPTWSEMCYVKNLFWDAEDCVIQYHPAASNYVNNHDYCLHLWRPIGITLPTPNSNLIGIL